MPRKQVEVLECDVAGRHDGEPEPYQVVYSDGTKEFILCPRHAAPLLKMKDADYGVFRRRPGRKKLQKRSIEELTQ